MPELSAPGNTNRDPSRLPRGAPFTTHPGTSKAVLGGNGSEDWGSRTTMMEFKRWAGRIYGERMPKLRTPQEVWKWQQGSHLFLFCWWTRSTFSIEMVTRHHGKTPRQQVSDDLNPTSDFTPCGTVNLRRSYRTTFEYTGTARSRTRTSVLR